MWGREMVSFQNDLRLKLIDFSEGDSGFIAPLLLGGSLWYDFTQLNRAEYIFNFEEPDDIFADSIRRNRQFEAMGYEIRFAARILLFPTLHRWGQAWDLKGNKLDWYYKLEIGF
jgi:hypothetical protein